MEAFRVAKKQANGLLEKEKQVIIESYRQGKHNQIECGIYGNHKNITPKQYYKETYLDNELQKGQ